MRLRDLRQNVLRSVTVKLAFLPLIFVSIPLIVYAQLKLADDRKMELLRDSVVQQDRLIVEVLKPFIEEFGQDTPQELQNTLQRLASSGTNVKLLYRPNRPKAKSFYYIASAPALSPADLDRERDQLGRLGIFSRLATCHQTSNLAVRLTNPTGIEEMLTSITSVSTKTGCWAIVTARTLPTFLHIVTAKPFWQTTSLRTAAIVYGLSAVIVVWLFVDIWRSIAQFRAAARALRLHGANVTAFRDANRIPEFSPVAEDFDALVVALTESQAMLKRAAEETAHAFKLPLAIIVQALEPLKRNLPTSNSEVRRSVALIEHSAQRLDGLVSAARDLDQASAEALYPHRWVMNLSAYVEKLLAVFGRNSRWKLRLAIEPGIEVLANEDVIELAVENLLDNAFSFAPPGSTITIALYGEEEAAVLAVGDEGPGVAPHLLEKIFERHYSNRPVELVGTGGSSPPSDHFGLGLWIVRRHVEGVGGSVCAKPNRPRGLTVVVRLPLAAGRPAIWREARDGRR